MRTRKPPKLVPLQMPTSIFCGLPVTERTDPTLAPIASPSRYGVGRTRSGPKAASRTGVTTRQMVSLTKNEQQAVGRAGAAQYPLRRPLEELADLQVADDEHEAEQKDEHVEIDGRVSVLEGEHAGDHHRHRAEQARRRAVQVDEREPLDGDEEVGDREDDKPGGHISQLESSTPWAGVRSAYPSRVIRRSVQRTR